MPWGTILAVVVAAVAALGLIVAAAFVAGRWFLVERYPDEVHYADPGDGWRIAILRYRPASPNGAEPVLLCHGIGVNRLHLDLADSLSMARSLAAAGYDTWLLELRGRGLSARPRLFGKHRYDWSFDEYVDRDAPAAIARVLAATGRERLHWVGVSLGGAIAYALLAEPERAARVRTAVAIAAPSSFGFQRRYLFSWPVRNLRFLRHRFFMRLIAPLAGGWSPKLFFNPANVDAGVVRRFLVNAAVNFAADELLQYGDWLEHDVFRSIDHRRDYRASLAAITTPMLFVAGNQDRIAPPPSVKAAHDAVSSTDKQFVIASRGGGMTDAYGHYDLAIGRHVADDIHPLVRGWLDRHSEKGANVSEGSD